MKKLVKKILKSVGLYNTIVKWRFSFRYRNINEYRLKYNGLAVKYSAVDSYSKKWFYPRYAGDKVHEPAIIDFFIKNLKKDTMFCDVGSNLGFFTCIGGKLCENGHVHAFEMDPQCIPLINKNIELNGLKNALINNNAVSDHLGIETIPKLSQPDSRLMIKGVEQQLKDTLDVAAITLDEYFINRQKILPDLIKIDAEGAEIKVLGGMKEIMKTGVGLKILIEIHCNKILNFGATYKNVLEILAQYGFSMYLIDSHRLSNLTFKKIDTTTNLSGNVMVFAEK